MFRRLESIGGDVIVRESQIHGVVCVKECCVEYDLKKIFIFITGPKRGFYCRGGVVFSDSFRFI